MATSTEKAKGWSGLEQELKLQAGILFGFTALLWTLELVDLVILGSSLDAYGVRPRSLVGLRGVLLAPLLHGGLSHLIANTGPLLVLGWLVMWRETRDWFVVGAFATIIGGLGVWLIGASNSVHIGASGIVFGFLGYLLLRGWFERKVLAIAGSIAVGLMYGGALWGMLPGTCGVSWEGHLFGFIGGVLAARVMVKRQSAAAEG